MIGQFHTRRWINAACPLYILPLFNVYRYANDRGSGVLQLYASQPIIYSANESLNAISFDRILLFTFLLMARKLYLNRLQGTDEMKFIYLSEFLLCQHMSYMYHSLRL